MAERPASDLPSRPYRRKAALPALTGLRAILAVLILLFHFTPGHIDAVRPIVDGSFVFVGCFFLISGFVLSYNYDDRALSLVKRDFWLARFSRLYPTYIFALVLSLPFLLVEWHARPHAEFWRGLVLTPLLLQGWSPTLATFWNTVAWTLSAEVMLYLAFPFLLRTWNTRAPHWNTRPRLLTLLIGFWILGIMPHLWYFLRNPDHLSGPADRYTGLFWIRVLKFTPPAYICTFLAGLTLGKLHLRLHLSPRQSFAAATSAIAILLVFFYAAASHLPYIIIHGALLLPVFCLLVLGLSGSNLIAKAFGWRPLVLFGEATFALYLLHFNSFLLLHAYGIPERLHLAALDPWISYAAILFLAWMTYRYIENPSRKRILAAFSTARRSSGSPKKAAPAWPEK